MQNAATRRVNVGKSPGRKIVWLRCATKGVRLRRIPERKPAPQPRSPAAPRPRNPAAPRTHPATRPRNEKTAACFRSAAVSLHLVGVAGFEPTASSSRTKRATKLRHTPVKKVTSCPGRDRGPAVHAATSTTLDRPRRKRQNGRSGGCSRWRPVCRSWILPQLLCDAHGAVEGRPPPVSPCAGSGERPNGHWCPVPPINPSPGLSAGSRELCRCRSVAVGG